MKRIKLPVACLIILLAASLAQAFPPRMHSERGTVASIDPKSQTITLLVCCEKQQFAWRDWTRIRIDGRNVTPQNIPVGAFVRVSYRHEIGAQALYELRSSEPRAMCAACLACAR